MKKFDNISDFENSLKESLSSHSTPAPPDVWNSVSTVTGQGASGLSQGFSFFQSATNLLKVALFAGGIAAIGIVVYQENKTESPSSSEELDAAIEDSSTPEKDIVLTDSLESTKDLSSKDDRENTKSSSQETRNKTDKSNSKTDFNINNQDMFFSDIKEQIDSQSDERNSEINDESSDPVSEPLELNISNTNPCKGDLITLTSNKVVKWTLDDKVLSEEATKLTYLCTYIGRHSFTISNNGKSETKTVLVRDNSFSILKTKKTEFEYTLSTDPSRQNVNWYVNGVSYEKNTNQINLELDQIGTHKITAKPVSQLCSDQQDISINIAPIGVIKVYDFFTPNGDGQNDEYVVDISEYERFTVQIFDLKGTLVFATSDPNYHWNGLMNNEGPICEKGEYVAKITYKLKGEKPSLETTRIKLTRE